MSRCSTGSPTASGRPSSAPTVRSTGPGLAAIAFHDDTALTDLNAIVHPAVREEIARRIDAARDTDHVVVLDTPLMTVADDHRFAAVVVVDAPVEIAVRRLVA